MRPFLYPSIGISKLLGYTTIYKYLNNPLVFIFVVMIITIVFVLPFFTSFDLGSQLECQECSFRFSLCCAKAWKPR